MNKIIYTISLCIAAALTAGAAEIDFSYNLSDATPTAWGTDKTETYDVAIRLDNPSLIGAKVKGIRVGIPSEGTADASAWITSELKLKKKNGKNVNDPDICTKEGVITDGKFEIEFDTPYTVPEEGCYVGYSFSVTEINTASGSPVSVVEGSDPSSLFLHTSRTKMRWNSASEELGLSSAMTVILEGDFESEAAYIVMGTAMGATNEDFSATVSVVNGAMTPVESIGYAYTAGEYSGKGEAVLEKAVAGRIGASGKAEISFGAIDGAGTYPVEIRVTSVNGKPTECRPTEGSLEIYPFIPANRPLVEEYTGLWCGWCPRGYMALEMMKKLKGGLFIAAAYHNGSDAMAFTGSTPNHPSGYPAAYINRATSVNLGNIFTDWDNYRNFIPEGDINVKVEWTDETHTAVRATSTSRFIKDKASADYRVSYILVADNLSNKTWLQSNSYSGHTAEEYPYMDNEVGRIFLEGKSHVAGLVFNDVALAATDYDGFPGSIPSDVVAGESYSHTTVFSLDGISEEVLTQPDYLRVIAVICDGRNGKFLNCNSSDYISGKPFDDTSGVKDIKSKEATEVARYAPDGRILSAPMPGINIILYSDGTSRKVLIK